MTVVGIPGRVVRGRASPLGPDGRIDLEHHLIPDPVGDAISVLIDRIDFLEARLAHLQARSQRRPRRKSEKETSHERFDDLRKLSSAEDFFDALGVEYDPAVVRVARLHILRRMGEYLAKNDARGRADDEVRAACQER